ncbi:unnamed protein product [Adineta steineri]|uniref:Proteasome activator PA28 C-terminal domain-containing protein n=1 Tax=Adineta steineri TaxID=433720 RepID=A0A813RZF8_9BILA|nr:unnamed protein product [Adineta steineri]CAF0792469.1 unnamed protein product [Adineta steineri]CAF3516128.1 unnamed protein product [Adineta steineri]CAF3730828.1 unnamed protein product [Adineta steineri]
MRSTVKKVRQKQSTSLVSHSSIELSNMTGDSFLVRNTESLEQSIKTNVESDVLFNLLTYAKQLNELIYNDERFSKDYFKEIEKNISNSSSNKFLNELIKLIEFYFEKYLLSSINLRCYIQLHVPSNESGNNQGVNIQKQILKEIQEMETIIEANENLFFDYYKKHYEILKYLNKYPFIEDYHLYLIEYERKIFDDIRSILLELRTIFLKTYDIIRKNLTKIQMPRNQENISMIN